MKTRELSKISLLVCLIVGLGLAAPACSGKSTKKDEKPVQEGQKDGEKDQKDGDGELTERDIPEYKPIAIDEAPDPKVEKLGESDGVTAHLVGGVKVLHKRTPATSVVSARVYLKGGSAHLTETTSGIERLALSVAVNGGTESHPKDDFNAALDSMGSSVSAFNERDYSGYAMQSVLENFGPTWDLMVETITEPALPESELELQREQHLADIRSLRDNPDRLVGYTATGLLFEGHPYATLQLGTEANVSAFTRDDIKAYQRAMLRPSDMVVVVVGNVSDDEIIERVSNTIARIDPGELEAQELTEFDVEEPSMKVAEKDIPTNYIFGLFPAPSPGDEDYAAMLVAVEYLRDRLFEDVRTKRNLTYAVSSGLSNKRVNYGYLYVTAVEPDKTMPVIYDEVDKLEQGKFSKKQLEQSRNVFLTEHYMDLETNGSQASLLAQSEIIAGDWKSHADFIEQVRDVSSEDVSRVAKTYMKNYQFGIVGKPANVDETLFVGEEGE
jgi:predicted Zn-dependent peptidase